MSTMTEKQKNDIVLAIKERIEIAGISQNRVATLAQVSGATISNILKGKWTSVSDAMWRKIRMAIGMGEEAIETSQFSAIIEALLASKLESSARIIDGRTGLGKTAASRYFQSNRPEETYLIRCGGDMTAKEFLQEVARRVGVSDNNSRSGLRMTIAEKLSKDKMPLLIIDEAENLKEGVYPSLKALYDDLEGKAGIVLIGANDYLGWLKSKAMRRRPGCFPQIFSRFKQNATTLGPLSKEDVRKSLEAYGIEDRATVNQLFNTCEDYRDLFREIRRMTNVDEPELVAA